MTNAPDTLDPAVFMPYFYLVAFVSGLIFGIIIFYKIWKSTRPTNPEPAKVVKVCTCCGAEYTEDITECPKDKTRLVPK